MYIYVYLLFLSDLDIPRESKIFQDSPKTAIQQPLNRCQVVESKESIVWFPTFQGLSLKKDRKV